MFISTPVNTIAFGNHRDEYKIERYGNNSNKYWGNTEEIRVQIA